MGTFRLIVVLYIAYKYQSYELIEVANWGFDFIEWVIFKFKKEELHECNSPYVS